MSASVIEQNRVTLNGVRVVYEEAGRGRPLVCIHGNYASKRWFTEQLSAPPLGWRVIAPDLPNFGESGSLPGKTSIEAYASYLADFMAQLGLESPVVLGHSLGGAVAQVYAARQPDALAGLLLVASAPPGSLYGLGGGLGKLPQEFKLPNSVSLPKLPKGIKLPSSSLKMPKLKAGGRSGERERLAASLRATMPSRPIAYFEQIVDDALLMRPAAVSGNLQALMSYDTRGLGRVRCPALILRGGRDTIITEQMARKTAASLPAARLELWPEVGHSPQLEAPERFKELLTRFLEGV